MKTEQKIDSAEYTNSAARRDRATRSRRSARLALVAAATAVVLAGCGGSKPPSVATLATTSTPTTAPAASSGNSTTAAGKDATGLLVKWAACMRQHGDPNQTDPSIDTHKVIHIPWDPAIPGGYNGTNKGGQGNNGPGQYCRTYLAKAQSALRGGTQPTRPDQAQLVKYSQCMRANGIPDFPDPTAKGLQLNHGGDLDPNNPTFQKASKLCARKTGVPGFGVGPPPPGTIALTNP